MRPIRVLSTALRRMLQAESQLPKMMFGQQRFLKVLANEPRDFKKSTDYNSPKVQMSTQSAPKPEISNSSSQSTMTPPLSPASKLSSPLTAYIHYQVAELTVDTEGMDPKLPPQNIWWIESTKKTLSSVGLKIKDFTDQVFYHKANPQTTIQDALNNGSTTAIVTEKNVELEELKKEFQTFREDQEKRNESLEAAIATKDNTILTLGIRGLVDYLVKRPNSHRRTHRSAFVKDNLEKLCQLTGLEEDEAKKCFSKAEYRRMSHHAHSCNVTALARHIIKTGDNLWGLPQPRKVVRKLFVAVMGEEPEETIKRPGNIYVSGKNGRYRIQTSK